NGKWVLNASAAELTNIWYGGLASICRKMQAIRVNYFLEDMVELRDEWTCDMLANGPDVEF
ncbi:hypothetical protein CROQUDRAFT_31798, partial [Cronartium quercuum f. sp. fusiforme G11]